MNTNSNNNNNIEQQETHPLNKPTKRWRKNNCKLGKPSFLLLSEEWHFSGRQRRLLKSNPIIHQTIKTKRACPNKTNEKGLHKIHDLDRWMHFWPSFAPKPKEKSPPRHSAHASCISSTDKELFWVPRDGQREQRKKWSTKKRWTLRGVDKHNANLDWVPSFFCFMYFSFCLSSLYFSSVLVHQELIRPARNFPAQHNRNKTHKFVHVCLTTLTEVQTTIPHDMQGNYSVMLVHLNRLPQNER